jgi:hypothetical protein
MKSPAALPTIALCVALSLIGVVRCDGQQAAAAATDSTTRAAAQPAKDGTSDSPCVNAPTGVQDKGSAPAVASPAAEEESVCLLVSGDLSRLRDGRDVVAPVGGLGDGKTKGVLHEMLSLESQSTVSTLRLLTGNNLGRAIKSGALSSAGQGLSKKSLSNVMLGSSQSIMVNSEALTEERKMTAYEKRLGQLRTLYAREGLSLDDLDCGTASRNAQANLESAGSSPTEKQVDAAWRVLEQCDGSLFTWQLQKYFDAVAIGPGDFNYSRETTLIQQLRHFPFLSANLFVANEEPGPKVPNKKDPRLLVDSQEIFPGSSVTFDIGADPVDAVCEVVVNGTRSEREMAPANGLRGGDPTWDESASFRFQFLSDVECQRKSERPKNGHTEPSKGRRVVYSYTAKGHSRKAVFPFDEAVTTEETSSVVTLKFPVPLSPATSYQLSIKYRIASPQQSKIIKFYTYELFTITYPWRKPPTDPRVTSTMAEHRETALSADSMSEKSKAATASGPMGRPLETGLPQNRTTWLGYDIPILCKVSQDNGHVQLGNVCTVSVFDEKKLTELPRTLTGKKSDNAALINRLRAEPMTEALDYWNAELNWLQKKKLIEELVLSPGGSLGKEIAEFCPLLKDARACQPEVDGADITIHLDVVELDTLLSKRQKNPAIVLLAQTDAAGLDALASKNSKYAVVVGGSGAGSAEPAASSSGVHGPLRLVPLDFGKSVDQLKLELASNSPWQVKNASYARDDGVQHVGVPGTGFPVLFETADDDGLRPCCAGMEQLALLAEWVLVSDLDGPEGSRLPAQDVLKADNDRTFAVLMEVMREKHHAEVALLPTDFVDPLSLRWLRSIRWLGCRSGNSLPLKCPDTEPQKEGGHYTVNLATASLEMLQSIPGIDPMTAMVIRKNRDKIRSRSDIKTGGVLGAGAGLEQSAYAWAKWFVHGPDDPTQDPVPYIDERVFVDLVLRRLIFVNHDARGVILTGDLAKTLYTKAASGSKLQGFSKDGLNVLTHQVRPIEGSLPLTVATSTPVAQLQGPYPEALDDPTVLRQKMKKQEDIGQEFRTEVLDISLISKVPTDAHKYPDVKAWVANRDAKRYWLLSLQQLGFSFNQISNSDNFKPISNEPATQAKSQRIISIGPRFSAGLYSPKVEWINTVGIDYQTNQISPNDINPVLDQYRLRTELDWYWQKHRHNVSFPFYVAGEFDSQFALPLGDITLTDLTNSTLVKTKTLPLPLTFPAVRQRDLIGEFGVLATNRTRTIWFRFGFAPDHNFNRLDSVTLVSGSVIAQATPGKISDAVNAANLAAFNAGQTLPFEPGKIPATLRVVSVTTPALAFGYSYQKDFQLPSNKNKKITIKSDSKEWNFYFRQANDNSSQPRFRIWIENSVKIPIWGNLSLAPGFDVFVYRSKPDSTGTNPANPMTFTSWRPTLSLNYSFDWKPSAMSAHESFRFENGKPQ